MCNWLRTLLFVSAFSPALLTLAYVRYDAYGWRTDVWQLAAIGLLGTFFPFAITKLVATTGESFTIQAKKVEPNDALLLAFVVSYFLPVIGRGIEMSFNSILLLLFVASLLLWLISTIPAHPLLRILRFRFYKLESSTGMIYTLISRREIRDPREVQAVKKISDTMLMEIVNV
jgi:hypothetical protein